MTLLVHGEEGLRLAERTTSVLYKKDLKTLSQLNVDEAILERCYYLKVWPLLNILTLIVLKHLIMMRVRKSLEAS